MAEKVESLTRRSHSNSTPQRIFCATQSPQAIHERRRCFLQRCWLPSYTTSCACGKEEEGKGRRESKRKGPFRSYNLNGTDTASYHHSMDGLQLRTRSDNHSSNCHLLSPPKNGHHLFPPRTSFDDISASQLNFEQDAPRAPKTHLLALNDMFLMTKASCKMLCQVQPPKQRTRLNE